MYLWAAYDKSTPYFHERMEHYTSQYYYGSEHPGPWFTAAMVVCGYGAVALEYALPFTLWWPRTRAASFAVGIWFHLVLYWTMSVSTYTCTMLALYLAYVDPKALHDFVDTLVGAPREDLS